jgi:hypothetical protein
MLSQDGNQEETRWRGRGLMFVCLLDSPVYAQTEDGKVEVVIVHPDGERRLRIPKEPPKVVIVHPDGERRLRIPKDPAKDTGYLSLSVGGVGDKVAVVDGHHNTLNIFICNVCK